MIIKFFELYAAAFLSLNSGYISGVYDFPVTFYTEGGDPIVFTEEQFNENTENLFGIYNKLSVRDVEFEIQSEYNVSNNLMIIPVQWRFLNENKTEIYRAITKYLIKHNESELRIKAVYVIDETTNFNNARATLERT